MLKRLLCGSVLLLAAAACHSQSETNPPADQAANAPVEQVDAKLLAPASGTPTSILRLDCGAATIKDFSAFFSDRPGLLPSGPREITDSCYLITHGKQRLLWDTGLPKALIGHPDEGKQMRATMTTSLVDQLAKLRLKPSDIQVVGISHMHGDHTGQAADFPGARLLIGKSDFDKTAGKDDPFGAWRGAGKSLTAADVDVDVFGDGDVVALFLPGHTPGHHALLVKLKSGPVLLSGDLYHSALAREKRTVPPFNTDRQQTLASMDRFEALAKRLGAKVLVQHEPADIGKLPAFPTAAE